MLLLIFVLALLPRVLSLDTFLTADEDDQLDFSAQFLESVRDRDWAGALVLGYLRRRCCFSPRTRYARTLWSRTNCHRRRRVEIIARPRLATCQGGKGTSHAGICRTRSEGGADDSQARGRVSGLGERTGDDPVS